MSPYPETLDMAAVKLLIQFGRDRDSVPTPIVANAAWNLQGYLQLLVFGKPDQLAMAVSTEELDSLLSEEQATTLEELKSAFVSPELATGPRLALILQILQLVLPLIMKDAQPA